VLLIFYETVWQFCSTKFGRTLFVNVLYLFAHFLFTDKNIYHLPVMTTKMGVEPVDPVREERTGKVREVGSQAIWSLSSCKPGISETELIFRFQLLSVL
jgi:hypothetical protein